jgi:16S rRNA (cytosine1402-N4)-methyltransferase
VEARYLRGPRPPQLKLLQRKAIVPGAEEMRDNPRSRSAQCRVFEKLETPAVRPAGQ